MNLETKNNIFSTTIHRVVSSFNTFTEKPLSPVDVIKQARNTGAVTGCDK